MTESEEKEVDVHLARELQLASLRFLCEIAVLEEPSLSKKTRQLGIISVPVAYCLYA